MHSEEFPRDVNASAFVVRDLLEARDHEAARRAPPALAHLHVPSPGGFPEQTRLVARMRDRQVMHAAGLEAIDADAAAGSSAVERHENLSAGSAINAGKAEKRCDPRFRIDSWRLEQTFAKAKRRPSVYAQPVSAALRGPLAEEGYPIPHAVAGHIAGKRLRSTTCTITSPTERRRRKQKKNRGDRED